MLPAALVHCSERQSKGASIYLQLHISSSETVRVRVRNIYNGDDYQILLLHTSGMTIKWNNPSSSCVLGATGQSGAMCDVLQIQRQPKSPLIVCHTRSENTSITRSNSTHKVEALLKSQTEKARVPETEKARSEKVTNSKGTRQRGRRQRKTRK